MKTIKLGKSDILVPAVAVGCMRIADMENDDLVKHLNYCIEQGLNFICSTLLVKISVDYIDTKLFCDLVWVTSTAAVNELVYDFHNLSRSVIPQSGSPPIL